MHGSSRILCLESEMALKAPVLNRQSSLCFLEEAVEFSSDGASGGWKGCWVSGTVATGCCESLDMVARN